MTTATTGNGATMTASAAATATAAAAATNIASIDMGGMFPESGKNIYISDSSYGYTEIDMINLFGSPAGRAINKITSIKLSKSEAAAAAAATTTTTASSSATTTTAVSAVAATTTVKMKSKSKDRTNHTNSFSCNSSGSSSFCYRATDVNSQNRNGVATTASVSTVFDEDQENSIKAISGTVGINNIWRCWY